MQTPLQLDIWLQSYEGFDNAKNSIKQRNWNIVFRNISKPISPTSGSFLLIMSHICSQLEIGNYNNNKKSATVNGKKVNEKLIALYLLS